MFISWLTDVPWSVSRIRGGTNECQSCTYSVYFVDDDSHCEDGYKFDTRTGRLWEYKDHWNPEKAKINDYTGIDHPSESESYDGRFTFKSLSNNGHSWFYVFDTKTGNFWTCKYREYAFHLLK